LAEKLNQENKVSLFSFILFLILIASFLIKNPFIVQPFLGHFGSYQSVLGMVAYEFAKADFANFLYPNSFMLTAGKPSLEMVYHPFSSFAAAFLWKVFGGNLDYWGRFQAMLFSGLSTVLIYLSAWRLTKRKSYALWSAFLFAFSPMGLIYGRVLMNESLALAALLASLYLLLIWRESLRNRTLIFSGLLFSLLLIFRLHYICFLPVFLLLIILTSQKKLFSSILFSTAAFPLTALWFFHTYWVTLHFPNVHTSLFTQVAARSFPDPLLFDPQFYRVLTQDIAFPVGDHDLAQLPHN